MKFHDLLNNRIGADRKRYSIANELGIAPSFLSFLCNGKRKPSFEVLMRILRVLKIPAKELEKLEEYRK